MMKQRIWSTLFNAIFCQLLLSPAILVAVNLNVEFEPVYQHVTLDSTVTWMCRLKSSGGLPRALTGCEMIKQDWFRGKTTTFLDLSLGSNSRLPGNYSYHGSGLENGECGLTIQPPLEESVFTMSCRVRGTDDTRWQYSDEAILYVSKYPDLPYTMTPHHVVALPGTTLNITTVADGGAHSRCVFHLPPDDALINLDKGGKSSDSTPNHRYLGRGLARGDCGLSLLVKDNQSGRIISFISSWRNNTWHDGFHTTILTVATAPESITLVLNNNEKKDDAMLSATCRVTNSRPIAKITWLLDGVVVRDDDHNEEPQTEEWEMTYDTQTITQTFFKNMTHSDSGKQLVCRVNHVALPTGTADSDTITFGGIYKPIFNTTDTMVVEGVAGEPLQVQLIARGNPSDITYSWKKLGTYKTYPPGPILRFNRLHRKDAGVYTCTAVNRVGSTSTSVRVIVLPSRSSECDVNPCGPNSVCSMPGGHKVCSCKPSFVGSPPSCRPECTLQTECASHLACMENVCRDPCQRGVCAQNTKCIVKKHFPVCSCLPGFKGNPYEKCEQEVCGQRSVHPVLIAGGQIAHLGEFPWHVGLYKFDGNSSYRQKCGGTLIAANIVISAAHCVYDEAYSRVNNASLYRIAVGKLLLGWEDDKNSNRVKRLEVANFIVQPNYRGSKRNFKHDIVIIVLSSSVITENHVPACLDWQGTLNHQLLIAGKNGTVAGWGLTNAGGQSSQLQWANLPYIEWNTCFEETNKQDEFAVKYLTEDKFCAGFINHSTSVCSGDSGGGFVVHDEPSNRYYLQGVVSTSLIFNVKPHICNSNFYTSFTSIKTYMPWITRHVTTHLDHSTRDDSLGSPDT